MSWQKDVMHSLYDLLIDDPVIKVKEFDGIFAIDVRSDLFFRIVIQKSYEPKLVNYCIKYLDKNRDVIDVGANIGFYTILFAKNLNNKKVLSIEPTKNAAQRLSHNVELNDVTKNVVIFEGVASNMNGTMEIKTIVGKEEYSSLGVMKHPSIIKDKYITQKVMSMTIDNLVKQNFLDPGFIKVDAEGVEHLVFEGAQNVLKEKRPIILSELSDFLLKENGSSSKEIINLIKNCKYDIFDPIDPSIQAGSKNAEDILCFPKEMGVSVNDLQKVLL
jgi:FkbM family methyltransferase